MKSFILIFLVNASIIHLIQAFNLEDHTTDTSITKGQSVEFICQSNTNFGTCTFEHNDEKCEFQYIPPKLIGGEIKAEIKKTNCEASFKDRMEFIGDLNNICKIRLDKVDKEMGEGQWSCELKEKNGPEKIKSPNWTLQVNSGGGNSGASKGQLRVDMVFLGVIILDVLITTVYFGILEI